MQPDLIEEAPLSPRVRRDLEIVAASYGGSFGGGQFGGRGVSGSEKGLQLPCAVQNRMDRALLVIPPFIDRTLAGYFAAKRDGFLRNVFPMDEFPQRILRERRLQKFQNRHLY